VRPPHTPSSAPVLLADKCFVGVSSYSPSIREYPAALWKVVDTVYADLEYAMEESGDLSQPIKEGLLKPEQVHKISTLLGGSVTPPYKGKSNFFKTVGMSLVGLTTAAAVYKNAKKREIGQAIQG